MPPLEWINGVLLIGGRSRIKNEEKSRKERWNYIPYFLQTEADQVIQVSQLVQSHQGTLSHLIFLFFSFPFLGEPVIVMIIAI